jgi:hypothetical protein
MNVREYQGVTTGGRGRSDHAARPDVSPGLWTSESGIPADPVAVLMTSAFAAPQGWCFKLLPRVIPIMIPRMHPYRKLLCVLLTLQKTTFSSIQPPSSVEQDNGGRVTPFGVT